jgi:hypothetical protein
MTRRPPRTIKHPLESAAKEAFARYKCHDVSSLAYQLAGTADRASSRAYRTVARDLLVDMEFQGKLERDRLGWWRLTETKEK